MEQTKKRKASKLITIKAFRNLEMNLIQTELLKKEDIKLFKELHQKAKEEFIKTM